MGMDKNLISYELKNLRLSKSLTQSQVSEETGLSVRTISNIENNKYFTFQDLVNYCDFLGYDLVLKKKKLPTIIIIDIKPEDVKDDPG